MYYFLSYDVSKDKTRNKIFKFLKDQGYHLQKSLFTFESDSSQKAEQVFSHVLGLIDKKSDRLFMVPLCRQCFSKKQIAGEYPQFDKDVWFV